MVEKLEELSVKDKASEDNKADGDKKEPEVKAEEKN